MNKVYTVSITHLRQKFWINYAIPARVNDNNSTQIIQRVKRVRPCSVDESPPAHFRAYLYLLINNSLEFYNVSTRKNYFQKMKRDIIVSPRGVFKSNHH